MTSGEGKVVCVTGGSGYMASWLVKFLLKRSYVVKATVRDPDDPKKTEHLLAPAGAKERLHLFKANLVEEGSFNPVIDGCDGVFHMASPVCFLQQMTHRRMLLPLVSMCSIFQADLIEPAVKGH